MKKNYFLTLLLTLFISGLSFGQVIITELADPNAGAGARFVEIYNVSDSDVDLTGWELRRWTNANTRNRCRFIIYRDFKLWFICFNCSKCH
jgi:hypothetical protein